MTVVGSLADNKSLGVKVFSFFKIILLYLIFSLEAFQVQVELGIPSSFFRDSEIKEPLDMFEYICFGLYAHPEGQVQVF